ncbi:MAG: ribosome recycling factor [Candidatus Yanofskybacteria bacterium]|nr:ribosome recycling factor [Candidatus Yanofskybacteria bacterium]
MIEQLIKDRRKEFEAAVEWLKHELAAIRTGRANPDMVSDIIVDYMGTPLHIKELAAISTPEPRSIAIQPWDKGALAAIEKAIRESTLQLAPVVDGTAVRLTVPPLTEERRKEYLKIVSTKVEEARIRVRQIREDILKKVQAAVKEKSVREDEGHRAKDQLQKAVDEFNRALEDVAGKKEKELMTV